MARVQVEVPADLKKWLQFRSVETGRTQSDLVTEALEQYKAAIEKTKDVAK